MKRLKKKAPRHDKMVDTLLLTALSGIAVCSVFFALAKRSIPLTPDDAEVIWKMHRKDSGCRHSKWHFITRSRDKIIGFKCECGYEYKQKRPLLSRTPSHSI